MNKTDLILKNLFDRDPVVHLQVVYSSELSTLFSDPDFDHKIERFARAFGMIGEPAHDPLFKIFQTANTKERYRIAIVLGHMGDTSVINVVLEALRECPESMVRSAAAETFIIIPNSQAIDDLINALNDPSLGVRKSAAKALGRISDRRAIPALEAACKVRENVGNAFSEEYTVEYYARGAIRIINQWAKKD